LTSRKGMKNILSVFQIFVLFFSEVTSVSKEKVNEYKIQQCISLVCAHEEKAEEKLNYPKLKVLPESQENIYNVSLSSNNPGDENNDLVQNVVDYFYLNKWDSSQVCDGKNTSRRCDKEYGNLETNWCDAGCAFDYNTLGDCRDSPFGYENKDGEKESVNPCFFLWFETDDYWNPEPNGYGGPDFLPAKHEDDQFQVGCWVETVVASDIDYYGALVHMKEDGFPSSNRTGQLVDNFIEKKELFKELLHLVGMGDNSDGFLRVSEFLYWRDPVWIDGIELMKKLKNLSLSLDPRDRYKKAKFEKLSKIFLIEPYIFEFGQAVNFQRIMKSLDEKAAAKLYQDLKKVKTYHELFELCTNAVVANNSQTYDENHIYKYCRAEGNKKIARNEKSILGFSELLEFTEFLEVGDRIPNVSSDVDNIMMMASLISLPWMYNVTIFAEDRELVEKLLKYKRHLWDYEEVKKELEKFISAKNKVRVTHYPGTEGFPKKYFPMFGYEETPFLAIKLHLQENKWLTPGSDVIVRCNSWYESKGWASRENKTVEFKVRIL